MILPRNVSALLMGRAPEARGRRRRPLPVWVPDPGATHPSQGHFETVDDPPTIRPDALELTPVDDTVAQALAEETRRLIRGATPPDE